LIRAGDQDHFVRKEQGPSHHRPRPAPSTCCEPSPHPAATSGLHRPTNAHAHTQARTHAGMHTLRHARSPPALAGVARAHERVHLVNHEDHIARLPGLLYQTRHAVLQLAALLGACACVMRACL